MASASLPKTDVAGLERPAGRLDAASALEPYRGPWNDRLAAHLLRRAGFGGTDAQIRRLAAGELSAAVSGLLDFSGAASLPAPPEPYDPRPAIRALTDRSGLKEIRKQMRRSAIALQRWWLDRMVATPAPLQEKMTLYFHGHFTTAAIRKGVVPQLVLAQNQLFRQNALGNLRELTWDVSIDPAMLLYLDNARNEAQHPNENYARELMELFTLGVDNYTESDVRESARAWTGWVVLRRDLKARVVPSRHDAGTKTVLGRTGNFNGRDVVNVIFQQPQCAAFFANSLLNYFVYNEPEPELVNGVAALLRAHDYELKPVLGALFSSNVFYSERAYRALVKSPVEFVTGAYRAFGLPRIDPSAQRSLAQMGQVLFYPPNVSGWAGGANWLTSQTMIARQNFLAGLVNSPGMDDGTWMQSVPLDAPKAAGQIVAELLQGDSSPDARAQLARYLDGAGTSALGRLSGENAQERVRGAAYLAMAMPAYQLN